MLTERDAFDALIRLANDYGRCGKKLYGYAVIPPATATGQYHVIIDARPQQSASESWPS